MLKKRLIASFIVKDGILVQSIGFKKYLPIGDPKFSIKFISNWDIDEIILLDISASSERRSVNTNYLELLSKHCFVPLTVGGGIKNITDVKKIIQKGADKVSINTNAIANPHLISEIAESFGTQSVVVSIDCKKESDGNYQVYSNSGLNPSGLTPQKWAKKVEGLGAGEILLNSIDRDGTKKGYDIDLIQEVVDNVNIPVNVCGGVGNYDDFLIGYKAGASSAVASNIFHFIEHSSILAKAHLLRSGIDVRLDIDANYKMREFDEFGRLLMLKHNQLVDSDFIKKL